MHKILVIEDDPTMLRVLSTGLTREGMSVITADEGERGLELAFSHHPEIILLDILMPNVDGLTVMEKIRKDTWGRNIPIVLMTNLEPNAKILERIARDQPSYYLAKSDTSINEILAKVHEILSKVLRKQG